MMLINYGLNERIHKKWSQKDLRSIILLYLKKYNKTKNVKLVLHFTSMQK